MRKEMCGLTKQTNIIEETNTMARRPAETDSGCIRYSEKGNPIE